jgi:hypothetical protein
MKGSAATVERKLIDAAVNAGRASTIETVLRRSCR